MVASDTILILALCAYNLIQSNQHGHQAQRHLRTDKGCEYVAKRYEGCENSSWYGKFLQTCHVEFSLPHHPVLFSLCIQFQVSGHKPQLIRVILRSDNYFLCCLLQFLKMYAAHGRRKKGLNKLFSLEIK